MSSQGTLAPYIQRQYFDNNGDPANVHKIFSYEAGTSTKQDTFSDAALTTPNANPLTLDAAGRGTIFLTPGAAYKFVLALSTDTDPPLSPIWTIDNVISIPASTLNIDIPGTAGEALTAGDVVYLSQGDGSRVAGRWYKADATNDYSSTLAKALGIAVADIADGSAGSIRLVGSVTGMSSLSIGSVYYVADTPGALTAVAPTKRRRVGIADSTTSLVMSQWLPTEPRTVATKESTTGNVGTGEDTLYSHTLTAGEIEANGMSVRGMFWGHTANNANAKTINVRVIEGANNTFISACALTASELGHWICAFAIIRTGPTTSRSSGQVVCGPGASTNDSISRAITAVTQPTVTWANAVEIRLSGEATANDDITIEGGFVSVVPGA